MKTILVTAFKPFDGRQNNMSLKVMNALKHVDTLALDVLFEKGYQSLQKHLETHQYDYIISLGEAPYKEVHLEHVALNIMHARIPDNLHYQPMNVTIEKDGPLALKSTLPLIAIAEHLHLLGMSIQHSYHAGSYVCNDLFYRLMSEKLQTPRGFIHIPNHEQYVDTSLKTIQAIIDYLK